MGEEVTDNLIFKKCTLECMRVQGQDKNPDLQNETL